MNLIRFRSNSLCIENISAIRLAKKYQTPFYCYSLAQLRNNFLRFNKIFKNIKPIICFSVKSNSNLTLLRELRKIERKRKLSKINSIKNSLKKNKPLLDLGWENSGALFEKWYQCIYEKDLPLHQN